MTVALLTEIGHEQIVLRSSMPSDAVHWCKQIGEDRVRAVSCCSTKPQAFQRAETTLLFRMIKLLSSSSLCGENCGVTRRLSERSIQTWSVPHDPGPETCNEHRGWLPEPKAERLWHAVTLWTQSLLGSVVLGVQPDVSA